MYFRLISTEFKLHRLCSVNDQLVNILYDPTHTAGDLFLHYSLLLRNNSNPRSLTGPNSS